MPNFKYKHINSTAPQKILPANALQPAAGRPSRIKTHSGVLFCLHSTAISFGQKISPIIPRTIMAWLERQSLLLPAAGPHLQCVSKEVALHHVYFILLSFIFYLFIFLCRTFARRRPNLLTSFLMEHLAATEILTAAPDARRHILNINLIAGI